MCTISQEEKVISHVRDWIYEFINLSIPMQRMCREEEMGGPHCNKEVLAMLKKMDVQKTNPKPIVERA